MEFYPTERLFTDNEYLSACYFLQVPMAKMREIKFFPLSEEEYNELSSRKSFSNLGATLKMKAKGNCVYYTTITDPILFLIMSYTLIYCENYILQLVFGQARAWLTNISYNQRILDKIERNREHEYENLKVSPAESHFKLDNFDIKIINKIMAKHNGTATIEHKQLILTFNKVTCGNAIEGSMLYKFIKIYLPVKHLGSPRLNASKVMYGFNNFIIEDIKKIRGLPALHPHIASDNNICFGNRLHDWHTYSEILNFPFLINTLYETVAGYNPESAYSNIHTIINTIKTLNYIYKNFKQMNPASNPAELSSHIFKNLNTCVRCGTLLDKDNYCVHVSCENNPEAEIKCIGCGSLMTIISRNENNPRHRVSRECRNTSCPRSPLYLGLKTGLLKCKCCGEDLKIEDAKFYGKYYDGHRLDDHIDVWFLWYCPNERHNWVGISPQYATSGTTIKDLTEYGTFQDRLQRESYYPLKQEETTNES